MAKTYKKKDKDTLEITNTSAEVINTVDRTEIQTKIDHLELDKQGKQLKIDELKTQIAILDT